MQSPAPNCQGPRRIWSAGCSSSVSVTAIRDWTGWMCWERERGSPAAGNLGTSRSAEICPNLSQSWPLTDRTCTNVTGSIHWTLARADHSLTLTANKPQRPLAACWGPRSACAFPLGPVFFFFFFPGSIARAAPPRIGDFFLFQAIPGYRQPSHPSRSGPSRPIPARRTVAIARPVTAISIFPRVFFFGSSGPVASTLNKRDSTGCPLHRRASMLAPPG